MPPHGVLRIGRANGGLWKLRRDCGATKGFWYVRLEYVVLGWAGNRGVVFAVRLIYRTSQKLQRTGALQNAAALLASSRSHGGLCNSLMDQGGRTANERLSPKPIMSVQSASHQRLESHQPDGTQPSSDLCVYRSSISRRSRCDCGDP